jgi:hypothetical protein
MRENKQFVSTHYLLSEKLQMEEAISSVETEGVQGQRAYYMPR